MRWREGKPKSWHVPGDVVLSPGGAFSYVIQSYPFCRLYWDKNKPEPHALESSWFFETKWQRLRGNYLSYVVTMLGDDTSKYSKQFTWTIRDYANYTRRVGSLETTEQ